MTGQEQLEITNHENNKTGDNIESLLTTDSNSSAISILDPRIAEQPIYLPDNMFIAKFKDLGVDEIIAAFVDPISTSLARWLVPDAQWLLPLTGPIAEKGIFIARHALEAKGTYKSTPIKNRKEYNFYLKAGLKHGASNVAKDIIFHDPIYGVLMGAGLMAFPDVHPAFISVADYVVSVPMAVGLDVLRDYIIHQKKIHNLKKASFVSEKYYESRFYVLNEKDPSDVMDQLMKEFNLELTGTANYTDSYFDINNDGLSGRTVKMRLRKRDFREFEKKLWAKNTEDNNAEQSNMLQIIYTRAREDKTNLDQCRYYPTKKEKLYAIINQDANSIDDISDDLIRNVGSKLLLSNNISKPIIFDRTVARNDELAVCTDKIKSDRPFYVLELKVYDDTRLLREAMRYLMVECPLAAVQTTYGKADMIL